MGKACARRAAGLVHSTRAPIIHLDTGFLIRALVHGSAQDRRLRQWLKAGNALGVSAIAWTEFLCRPVERRLVQLATHIVPERVPFLEEDAALSARLFNDSGR